MRSLLFLFKEFVSGLAQNRFLHLTYGVQVTISLLVLGVFFVLLILGATAWGKLGSALKVHVYLKDEISAEQVVALENQLEQLEHVTGVKYRSKEEALEVFASRNTSIPLEDLQGEDNPLPASYIVTIDRPANIPQVVERIEPLSGVEQINYGAQVLQNYLKVLSILVLICVVTITLLVVFTYSSISNIIGLSVYARRTEIRIQQLVGATWWFIRWPFLFEGVFVGVSGAAIAMVIIVALLAMLSQAMRLANLAEALPGIGLAGWMVYAGLAVLLIGLGAVVGFVGSFKSVNAYLRQELQVGLDAAKVRQLVR
jgi:cell division transport system permease protein